MAIRFTHERDHKYRVDISGLLREEDFGALRKSAEPELHKAGRIRSLTMWLTQAQL